MLLYWNEEVKSLYESEREASRKATLAWSRSGREKLVKESEKIER